MRVFSQIEKSTIEGVGGRISLLKLVIGPKEFALPVSTLICTLSSECVT